MPAFPASDNLPDSAVLWAATPDSYTEFGRQELSGTPIEIDCWAKQFSHEVSEGNNDSTSSEAKLGTEWVVDRYIEPNSKLWFGTLDDWLAGSSPSPTGPLWLVKSCTEVRDDLAHGDDEVIAWNAHLEKLRNLP